MAEPECDDNRILRREEKDCRMLSRGPRSRAGKAVASGLLALIITFGGTDVADTGIAPADRVIEEAGGAVATPAMYSPPDADRGVEPEETTSPLNPVSVPEGYVERRKDEQSLIAADQSDIQPIEPVGEGGREDLALIRQPITSAAVVIGITVPGAEESDSYRFSYRTQTKDLWSDWREIEAAEPVEAIDGSIRTVGSDPVVLVNVTEVEAIVRDVNGLAVKGAQLSIIDPSGSEMPEPISIELGSNDQQSGDVSESSSAVDEGMESPSESADGSLSNTPESTPSMPSPADDAVQAVAATSTAVGFNSDATKLNTNFGVSITTRKGWAADETLMTWKPEKINVQGIVVHHTAGSNNYTRDQVPGLIRSIYTYHAKTLHWGDIGYHVLIDKFGGVWEGRSGSLTTGVKGGHAIGANSNTIGVSVLGNYETASTTSEMIESLSRVIAWKLDLHGLASASTTISVEGAKTASPLLVPVISGHRDVGYTACPGANLYANLPKVRVRVAEILKERMREEAARVEPTPSWDTRKKVGWGWSVGKLLAAGPFSSAGATDALLVKSDGSMWLYPGTGGIAFRYARQIGHGWTAMDQVSAGIDFDGDGRTDIVARKKATGDLYLYRGNGQGGFFSTRRIGWGWGGFSSIFALADYREGRPAILAIESATGRLRAYPVNGTGGFAPVVAMGTGWKAMRSISSIADRTGDGIPDVIAVDRTTGTMWLYAGTRTGALGARTRIGSGWTSYPTVLALSDGAMWAVQNDGTLWRYRFVGFSN